MFTNVDLCSRALLKLGERPISSFSDGSAAAMLASNLYSGVLNSLLVLHPWDFAKENSRIVYSYRDDLGRAVCALPNDCLRVISVDETKDYEIIGKNIHTGLATIHLNYIKQVSESDLPDYFASLMVLRLAMEFCLPLTENQTLYRTISVMFDSELKNAKYIDSSQSNDAQIHGFSLVNSRF